MYTRSNSIFVRLTGFITLLVFGQSLLLAGVLLATGLLSHTQENAIQSFHQQVTIRKNYLQAEIHNRWMNIGSFEQQIALILPDLPADRALSAQEYNSFFTEVTPVLIALLRSSLATGAFVVLDAPGSAQLNDNAPLPALYLRDYDPAFNDTLNRDLFLVLGPSELASRLEIPLDTDWRSQLPQLEPAKLPIPAPSRSFFNAPRSQAREDIDPHALGFWSNPFRVTQNDIPVITYSIPLMDQHGKARGVLGIEVNMIYLSQFLESAGDHHETEYVLALREMPSVVNPASSSNAPTGQANPPLELEVITASYGSLILPGQKLDLRPYGNAPSIYSQETDNTTKLVSAEPLPFYSFNTPFQSEQWYFVGMEQEQTRMAFVENLRSALMLSFLGSLALGIICGMWGSWRITQPVTRLAQAVRSGYANPSTEATGLAEIDDLAAALADAYKKRQESTVTMSRIIELVDEPIGAFELGSRSTNVLATDLLGRILGWNEVEADALYRDKTRFMSALEALMSNPEPEEKNVYKICKAPAKWVRMNIRTTEERTLGVVMDVSQEIQAKLKIRFDRDYDALTRLRNHASFQKQVKTLLPHCLERPAALIMFDLDNLKPVNDTYGHGWGDIYIKTAAQLLSAFRTNFSKEAVNHTGGDPRVLVGRRSGDEFVVFLHDFDSRDQILALVDEFYTTLEGYTLAFPDGDRKHIAISGGLAWVEPGVPYDELLQCADFTLYNAKRNFKGKFCVADEVENSTDDDKK